MSQELIAIGDVPNDGAGDPLRTAFTKCNDNFTELYSAVDGFSSIYVPQTRTINGYDLSSDVSLSAADIGAVPSYSGLTTNGLFQATSDTAAASTLTPSGLTSIGANALIGSLGSQISFPTSTIYSIYIQPVQKNNGVGVEVQSTIICDDGNETVHFQVDTSSPTIVANSSHQFIGHHPFYSNWSIASGITDSGTYAAEKINFYCSSASMLGTLNFGMGSWIRVGMSNTGGVSARVNNMHGVFVDCELAGQGTITSLYGYRFIQGTSNTTTVTNLFGLYIGPISKGVTSNYAIFTEGAGLVKISDTTGATTGGAGALVVQGGFYAAKDIIGGLNIYTSQTTNSDAVMRITNASTGTAAINYFSTQNSINVQGLSNFGGTGSGYTGYGFAANTTFVWAKGNGIDLLAEGASAAINMKVNGTTVRMSISAAGNVTIPTGTVSTLAGVAWNLGAANSISPTSPNRTLTVTVAGTTYYIAAKTTND